MTKIRTVYKYGTGHIIPDGATYLWSCKDGKFVWHYFLVEVEK